MLRPFYQFDICRIRDAIVKGCNSAQPSLWHNIDWSNKTCREGVCREMDVSAYRDSP